MALGDGTAWDESTPSNATNISDGDDHIRDLRLGTRLRLAKEHVTPAASSVGGEHKFLTLQAQGAKPTLSGSQVSGLYVKDVGAGVMELFFEDEAGNEIQVTSGTGLNVTTSSPTITGEVRVWGGTIATVPSGWLVCDGTAVSRATYATLFAAISTTHGVGDGSTTFNLPDMTDRFLFGVATGGVGAVGNKGPTSTTSPTLAGTGNDMYLRTKNAIGEGNFEPGGTSGDSCSRTSHQHSYMPRYYCMPYMIKT